MRKFIKNTFLLFLLITISSCNKDKKQNETLVVNSETSDILLKDSLLTENTDSNKNDTLTFKWQADMCYVTGYYLAGKWTKHELQNTLDLWHKLDNAFIGSISIFYPQNIREINTPKLTKEYHELISYINKSEIINLPFWQKWKETEIKNITMRYELTKMKGEAFSNPSVLLNNKYIDKNSDCQKYAIALNSGEEAILKAWEEWIYESKKNNGNPEAYIERYRDNFNSSNRMDYARIDLITFAWWNCVNHLNQYPDHDKLSSEFEKLFIRTEYDCEEP